MSFEVIDGSAGLTLDEVAHIMVPGRGRDATGVGISWKSAERTDYAATLYVAEAFEDREGLMVLSGNKTPGDKRPGIPEAEGMNNRLDQIAPELLALYGRTVPVANRRLEARSIDTVTNFTQTEAHLLFGDDRPVAIVSHAQHLERILRYVAPKTLRRDYIGVVVPEASDQVDVDTKAAEIVSKTVLFGVRKSLDRERMLRITDRRARAIWKVVDSIKKTNYNTDMG